MVLYDEKVYLGQVTDTETRFMFILTNLKVPSLVYFSLYFVIINLIGLGYTLVPNSVTTIFGFSLIGRHETIRKTERQRKYVSNLFNHFMIYEGQTCAFII